MSTSEVKSTFIFSCIEQLLNSAHVFITELNGAMKINGDAKLPDQNQLGMKDRDVEMEAGSDIKLEEEEKGNDDITINNKYWDNEKEDSLSSTEWSKIATTI